MASKKKLLTSVVALGTAAALTLGGTFAWQSINQTVVNEGSNIVNPGGRLHDDFDGSNKDVYVENFASQPIFTRIRLEEYFKVAVNTGHGNHFSQDVIGEETLPAGDEGVATYTYRIFTDYDQLNTEDNTISACWELEGEDQEPTTSYFQWTMGSADSADAYYMPTFNLNKDSLAADVNGYYNQGTGVISSKDVEGGQYSDYTAYDADSTEDGTEIYDADENSIDEVGKDFSAEKLEQYVTAGNIRTKENTHTARKIGTTRGLISMEKWLEQYDAAVEAADGEAVDMSELNSYWVYDTDGWVYWSGAIAAQETTGRLLDSIEMTERMEDGWYYALNVVAQFITAGDLGQKEGNTGFYDANSGTPPTKNALKLLAAIGVVLDEDYGLTLTLGEATTEDSDEAEDFTSRPTAYVAANFGEAVTIRSESGGELSLAAMRNREEISEEEHLKLEAGTDYTVNGNTYTFLSGGNIPTGGAMIEVRNADSTEVGYVCLGADDTADVRLKNAVSDAAIVKLGEPINLTHDGGNFESEPEWWSISHYNCNPGYYGDWNFLQTGSDWFTLEDGELTVTASEFVGRIIGFMYGNPSSSRGNGVVYLIVTE